jgi:signal transduction histidine kinase/ligand-binding sensor domain-containing protein
MCDSITAHKFQLRLADDTHTRVLHRVPRMKKIPLLPTARIPAATFLLLVTSLVTLHAQYHIDVWTTVAGLPQNTVYSILQTRDGYVWFTTLDGLVRFDGVRFTVYNRGNGGGGINSNRFTALHESADGTLWAGTEDGGLTRYRDGRFKTYTANDGLPDNGVWAIRDDKAGGLLVSTNLGPTLLRGDRFEAVLGQGGASLPRCIDLNAAGACWYQDAIGLHRSLNGETTTFSLPAAVVSKLVTTIYEDREHAVWIALRGGGLVGIKPDGSFSSYDAKDGLVHLPVTAISQDHQGRLWFGTAGGGLLSFEGARFVTYLEPTDKVGIDDIRTIYEDRESNLWLGKRASGLAKLVRQIVTVRTKNDGLSGNNVYAVLEDRSGKIWVGVWESGVNVSALDGRFAKRADVPFGFPTALYEDSAGRIWVGSNHSAIGFIEDDRWTDVSSQIGAAGAVFVIRESSDGSLWFGTRSGLLRYRGGSTTRYTMRDGLPSDDVKDILEDRQKRLWFATFGGLARLEGDRFVNLTEADGLSSNHVRTLYEDSDGTLWVGTYDGGLNRLRDKRLTRYTTANGLFSSGVFRIIEDGRGRFWVSSNRGIYRLNKAELNDFAEGRIKSVTSVAYGLQDGLISTECNGGQQPAGWKTRNGHIVFPTQEGLAFIDPESVTENPLAPPVVIENSSLDGQPVKFAPEIRVGPGQQNLEINYTGLSFVKPEQVRFKYKLEGLDGEWVEAGSRRTAYYSYLPPGTYVFRVLAANSDSVWNPNGASVSVVVTPPFYRTRWFYLLIGLSVAGVAFAVYETRLQRLRRAHAAQRAFSQQLIELQEGERKRIAAGLHDSLGQNLLIIKNRALLGLQKPLGDSAAHDQLEEISGISSQALDEVREIAYALHPYQMDRLGLTKAVLAMLNKVATASDIEFSTEIQNIDGLFPKDSEINIYRIVQESVNNIVKHSGTKSARVAIKRIGSTVQISVADDGKGFSTEAAAGPSAPGSGFGLAGISERARMLGGKELIHSTPGKGTSVTVRILYHSKGVAERGSGGENS